MYSSLCSSTNTNIGCLNSLETLGKTINVRQKDKQKKYEIIYAQQYTICPCLDINLHNEKVKTFSGFFQTFFQVCVM